MKSTLFLRALLCASVLASCTPALAQMPATQVDTNGVPHVVQPVYCLSSTCVNASASYTESVTALGVSGIFTGGQRAAPAAANYFNCKAFADQSGATLYMAQSDDSGVTYYNTAQVQFSSGFVSTGIYEVTARTIVTGNPATTKFECAVVNGSTAMTTFRFTSSFTAN